MKHDTKKQQPHGHKPTYVTLNELPSEMIEQSATPKAEKAPSLTTIHEHANMLSAATFGLSQKIDMLNVVISSAWSQLFGSAVGGETKMLGEENKAQLTCGKINDIHASLASTREAQSVEFDRLSACIYELTKLFGALGLNTPPSASSGDA